MKITPIIASYSQPKLSQPLRNESGFQQQTENVKKGPVAFGWCWPHVRGMTNLNEQFSAVLKKHVDLATASKNNIARLNELKNTRYSLLDDAAAKVTELFSKYSNTQYSVAEMIPSYALKQDKKIQEMLKNYDVMNNPITVLVAINNVTKLNAVAGVDKNTSKPYTPEQTRKAKAGTQLYTTVLLMEQLSNITQKKPEIASQVNELIDILKTDINNIYGNKTYERIVGLSNIGGNPTLEQKRQSINLIREFDEKAKELSFSKEFEEGLKKLIIQQNEVENRTIEGKTHVSKPLNIKVAYHTHGKEHSHSDLDEHTLKAHTHHEEFASEAEHEAYHLKEQQEMQKKLQ